MEHLGRLLAIMLLLILGAMEAEAGGRVMTAEEPPTNYMYEGEIVGTTTDMVREIMRRVGETSRIEFLPGARMMAEADREANIVLFTAAKTQGRISRGYTFLGPVITRRHALYMKAGSDLRIAGFKDVKSRRLVVAGTLGDWRTDYMKSLHMRVDVSTRHELNLKKLLEGRVSLMISSDIEMASLLRRMELPANAVELAYVFREAPSYILFSYGTAPEVIQQWENAFSQMQGTDFFTTVADKYHRLLGIDFSYTPEKGFHIAE